MLRGEGGGVFCGKKKVNEEEEKKKQEKKRVSYGPLYKTKKNKNSANQ